jgi:hypothetical protein
MAGVVAAACLAAAGCSDPSPTLGRVVGMSTRVEALADGSLRVREAFELEPVGEGPIAFHRHLVRPRTDALVFESADVDGRPTRAGHEGLHVSSPSPHALDVTWEGAGIPGNQAARRLVLTFRAVSAIAVTEPRATIQWPILDGGRGFDVGPVSVELVLPAGAAVYQGTGMIEAGWQVELTGTRLTASRDRVTNAETATLAAAFDFDRSGVRDPAWERNLDRQRQFLPALVAGGVFFLVIGVGTIVILRAQYPSTTKPRPAGSAPLPAAADRAEAARGLVIAGLAGAAMALVTAVASGYGLAFLGPWPQLIPASMLAASLAFILYAPRLKR